MRPGRRRRRTERPARLVGALAMVVLVIAGGCGLGANDEPQPLDRENVPPAALDDDTQTTAADEGVQTVAVTVYFVQTDSSGTPQLVSRGRRVPSPDNPEARLRALITQPPNQGERADGISTYVPEDASILSRPETTDEGVLVVNLSDNFYELQGEASRNAFAQVVFTATEFPGVESVRFQLAGEPFDALDGEGQSRRSPVDRDAYRNLVSD